MTAAARTAGDNRPRSQQTNRPHKGIAQRKEDVLSRSGTKEIQYVYCKAVEGPVDHGSLETRPSAYVKQCRKLVTDVREMLGQLRKHLKGVQHARYAHYADLKVCEHCLKLRSEASPEELAVDGAHKALHAQQSSIINAREELSNLEEDVSHAISIFSELVEDIQRIAAIVGKHIMTEPNTDHDLLLKRAKKMLAAATQLGARCGEAVQRTNEHCAKAKCCAEAEVGKRARKSEMAAKLLRKQTVSTAYTIASAKKCLASRSLKYLTSETGKGSILPGGGDATRGDMMAEAEEIHGVTRDLSQTRQQLQEETNQNMAMQSVNQSCLKVTAHTAVAEDLAATGDHLWPRTPKVVMRRSVSSPTFKGQQLAERFDASSTMSTSLGAFASPKSKSSSISMDCESPNSTQRWAPLPPRGACASPSGGQRLSSAASPSGSKPKIISPEARRIQEFHAFRKHSKYFLDACEDLKQRVSA